MSLKLPHAPRRNLARELVLSLRNEIISGKLQQGEPLAEPVLAERFGVSRAPVREALIELEHRVPFEGEATATLYGLPDTLPVAPVKFTKITTDLVFQIPTNPDSAVTKHANLFVQSVVPTPTGPLLQRFAFGGTLRVDAPPKMAPPPPVPPPAAPVVASVAPPPPTAPPPPKLLTRLEQLREKLAKTK